MFNRILNLRLLLLMAFALVLVTGTTGCDSGGSDDENQEVSFQVSSIPVTLVDDQNNPTPGLQFFVTSDNNVELVAVTIKPPVGASIPYNPNRMTLIRNESAGLQAANQGYFRVSGNWTFTFEGNFTTGSRDSFNKVVTVPVGASPQI